MRPGPRSLLDGPLSARRICAHRHCCRPAPYTAPQSSTAGLLPFACPAPSCYQPLQYSLRSIGVHRHRPVPAPTAPLSCDPWHHGDAHLALGRRQHLSGLPSSALLQPGQHLPCGGRGGTLHVYVGGYEASAPFRAAQRHSPRAGHVAHVDVYPAAWQERTCTAPMLSLPPDSVLPLTQPIPPENSPPHCQGTQLPSHPCLQVPKASRPPHPCAWSLLCPSTSKPTDSATKPPGSTTKPPGSTHMPQCSTHKCPQAPPLKHVTSSMRLAASSSTLPSTLPTSSMRLAASSSSFPALNSRMRVTLQEGGGYKCEWVWSVMNGCDSAGEERYECGVR